MAKKTARPAAAKPTQQRSKEEQWRRRMAQQSQTGVTSVVAPPENAGTEAAYAGDVAQTSTATSTSTSMPARTANSATNARRTANLAAQRAATTAARTRAARLGAQNISVTDEMRFIRADIRKLVVMTAFCVAVLLVLSFVVPMVYK